VLVQKAGAEPKCYTVVNPRIKATIPYGSTAKKGDRSEQESEPAL
jgi:hypothetical protein